MATVNLNETAKVKHILSLAQAINAKLDGDGSAFDTSVFEPVDTRQTPTLSLATSSIPASSVISQHFHSGGYYETDITYTGDGELSVFTDQNQVSLYATIGDNNGTPQLKFFCSGLTALSQITEPIVFTVKATGSETYCWRGSTKGRKLAEKIHAQITNSLPVVNRGVKEAGFFVLANTDCPAVLVETAFLDNPFDARLLVEREDDFARAIARGVSDYFANDKPLPNVIDTPKNSSGDVGKHFAISEFV